MPTTNPVPSYDPTDLLFNAEKLDQVVNSTSPSYTDRLGVQRRTLAGLEAEFPNAAANAAAAAAAANSAAALAQAAATQADLATTNGAAQVALAAQQVALAEIQADLATTNGGIQVSLATAQADIAQAARVDAEAARDAAMLSSGVYATTAAGLAATVSGRYFSVPSADSAEYLILYLNNAGSAVEQKRYASASAVAAVSAQAADLYAAFDATAPKNKYNPALAVDGQIYAYTTGAATAFANSAISGRIHVTAGLTYTLSRNGASEVGFFPNVFCWDASGNYLGMAATVGGSPVVSGMNLSFSDPTGNGGYRQMTFTVPVGSGVAFVGTSIIYGYVAHTTADFDRIRNATMLEIGSVETAFEPYTDLNYLQLKDERLPNSSKAINEAFVIGDAAVLKTENLPIATRAISDAFNILPSKNIYNKANAIDGVITEYATGLNTVYAPGMALGNTPVSAGVTYTASIGSTLGFHANKPIYCYNSAGAFLGVDHTIVATAGMANPPTNVVWNGLSSVTFTIPAGSQIAYVSFQPAYSVGHNTAFFESVIATVQVEVGSAATAYESYYPNGRAVLIDSTAAQTGVTAPLSVTKSGNDIYIRNRFTATSDLVQKVTLATGVAFTNDTINVQGARSAAKELISDVDAWTSGAALQTSGDDSAPLQYNGTYIGANHGAFIVRETTATAHGKTVVDVGSEWVDGASRKWVLMRVVDANKLWFVSENLSVYPAWSFAGAFTGSTLTHSAGATNTAAITIASSVTTQLYQALQNQVKTVLLDGVTPVTADGVYRCNTLHIVESYNICNPAAVVSYVKGLVGGSTQPAFNHPSIAADIKRTLTYQYAENGSCSIVDGTQALNSLTLGYLGATQAMPLNFTGKQLWQYIPRVTPKTNASGTWDFAAQANIGGTFELISLTSANWTDPNNPPDRMAQIVKTGGVSEFGLMVGYSPRRSVGLPAVRKTLINEACFVSTAKKQYPKAVNIGPMTAGSYYEIAAFRAWWPASAAPQATAFTWYRDGKNVIVVADFHQSVSVSPLVLPAQFTGMDVEVIDKSPSLTLHGNGVVAAGGLLVSVTGGYGYGVFKLS